MDNYRPISVLSAVSKLIEKAVHHHIYHFLSEHKLLTPFQCGFRKKHSTENAAITFSAFVWRGMDEGILTGAVFIDLRKAFDSVDHKLERYGLSEKELSWFCSYLTERRQVGWQRVVRPLLYHLWSTTGIHTWPVIVRVVYQRLSCSFGQVQDIDVCRWHCHLLHCWEC